MDRQTDKEEGSDHHMADCLCKQHKYKQIWTLCRIFVYLYTTQKFMPVHLPAFVSVSGAVEFAPWKCGTAYGMQGEYRLAACIRFFFASISLPRNISVSFNNCIWTVVYSHMPACHVCSLLWEGQNVLNLHMKVKGCSQT